MQASGKTAFLLGTLTALLWSPHFLRVQDLVAGGDASLFAVYFHVLLWPALALLALSFLTGRGAVVSVFKQRETHFLVLAGTGGYGFWLLRALALESGPAAHAHVLFYAAPLLMAVLSRLTAERADAKTAFGLALGFMGCILLVFSQDRGVGSVGAGSLSGWLQALGAAFCWAVFTVSARPIMREEKAIPAAAVILGIGAVFLLFTCLGRGENPLALEPGEALSAGLTGLLTVGLMMVVWLKCIAASPVKVAAPFWYLGLLFGLVWARGRGIHVDPVLAAIGAVLLIVGLWYALLGRRRSAMTMGDVIRG